METQIKKLFDDNFDFAFKAATYNNMRVAIQTFKQFKKKNEDFLYYKLQDGKNISQNILDYMKDKNNLVF